MSFGEFKDLDVTLRKTINHVIALKKVGIEIKVDENTIWLKDLIREEMKRNSELRNFNFDNLLKMAIKELT